MRIWIRKRLDISANDMLHAFKYSLFPGSLNSVESKINSIWETENQQTFTCLSVRTGFDLLFKALEFEPESEVIMSALTIPDMPKIVEHHGLVPVPVDLELNTLAPSLEYLEAAITSKTKAIVIAHLFGGIVDLDPIIDLARRYQIMVIEDCAQAFYSPDYLGNHRADVSMFSFGTIKTATALGGGILVFRNSNNIVNKMMQLHLAYPKQSRLTFLSKVSKYFLINFLSLPRIFPLVINLLERKGMDYDAYIHTLSKSFPNGDFFEKIRKQPSLPLLKLMLHRFRSYQYSNISERIERGNLLLRDLPNKYQFPGRKVDVQTFWAFPVLSPEPEKLILTLRDAGIDATRKISLKIVGKSENQTSWIMQNTESLLSQIVFLPLYPEMPINEIENMARYLKDI